MSGSRNGASIPLSRTSTIDSRRVTALVADPYLGSLLLRKGDKSMTELREYQEPKTYADKILRGYQCLLFLAHIGGSAAFAAGTNSTGTSNEAGCKECSARGKIS